VIQQFHQYQQNEQSPLTLKHRTQKQTMKYDVRIPGHGFGQAQKCGRAIFVNRILTLPHWYLDYQREYR
jgi:hypothetical protein